MISLPSSNPSSGRPLTLPLHEGTGLFLSWIHNPLLPRALVPITGLGKLSNFCFNEKIIIGNAWFHDKSKVGICVLCQDPY